MPRSNYARDHWDATLDLLAIFLVTHLGIAIAYRAIQHGYGARFVGADALIAELSRAAAMGRLALALEPFLHLHVLMID